MDPHSKCTYLDHNLKYLVNTLESVIDVGQRISDGMENLTEGIKVGP